MSRNRNRAIGLAFIGVILGITVIIFSGVFRKPFAPDARTIYADFERAAQLHAGDQVRLEGNVEGKVLEVKPGPTPEEARVKMEVEDDAGEIYADARARLKVKTLLGGAFYVEIARGTSGAGPLRRTITSDRTSVQTEIEDVTDVFRGDAVTGLQTLPRELAETFEDPEKPAKVFETVNDIAKDAATGIYAVRGQEPGEDLPRLVSSAAKTTAALDSPTDEIKTVVAGAAATLRTTGERAESIRLLLREAPSATYDLAHTLGPRINATLRRARGLIHRLDKGLPQLAPTLAELRPTLPLGTRVLARNKPLLAEVGYTAQAGGQLGTTVNPVLNGVKKSLTRTDDVVLPYLARKDPITGFSTTVMTGGFFSGFGGVASQRDKFGHFVRFPASIGASSAYLPCSSNLIDATAQQVLACDSLQTALQNYLSYVPPANGGGAPVKKGAGR